MSKQVILEGLIGPIRWKESGEATQAALFLKNWWSIPLKRLLSNLLSWGNSLTRKSLFAEKPLYKEPFS